MLFSLPIGSKANSIIKEKKYNYFIKKMDLIPPSTRRSRFTLVFVDSYFEKLNFNLSFEKVDLPAVAGVKDCDFDGRVR